MYSSLFKINVPLHLTRGKITIFVVGQSFQNSMFLKNMQCWFIRIYITVSQVRDFCLNFTRLFFISKIFCYCVVDKIKRCQNIHLFVEAQMPVTLVRQLAIFQKGLRRIWKQIKSPIFLHILLMMKLVRHLILKIILK